MGIDGDRTSSITERHTYLNLYISFSSLQSSRASKSTIPNSGFREILKKHVPSTFARINLVTSRYDKVTYNEVSSVYDIVIHIHVTRLMAQRTTCWRLNFQSSKDKLTAAINRSRYARMAFSFSGDDAAIDEWRWHRCKLWAQWDEHMRRAGAVERLSTGEIRAHSDCRLHKEIPGPRSM